MLHAGRRSTDLLHLLLQNLYAMQHMRGYAGEPSGAFCRGSPGRLLLPCCACGLHTCTAQSKAWLRSPDCSTHCSARTGTSSLLAATLLRELLLEQGVGLQQRQQLVGRVMGTHAHEMHSMTQQLCGLYDWESRRCGLQVGHA